MSLDIPNRRHRISVSKPADVCRQAYLSILRPEINVSPLSILLVDDDELSLEIAALQLASVGHTVTKAATGAEAIAILSRAMQSGDLPDAILTDMQMPDMNGAGLCSAVHAMGAKVPAVLAMSATRPSDDQLRAFDGFVQKPIDVLSLPRALNVKPKKMPPSSVRQMPVQTAEQALDPVILKKLRVLMPPAALDELLTAYLQDTRTRLVQMDSFISSGDNKALRSCAHMIKGSASMAGATRIARMASQLETDEVSTEQQRRLIDELRCACDAIEGTLAREDRRKEAHDHQIPRHG